MNTQDLIDSKTLFADDDSAHACCSCCNGYCPAAEGDRVATIEWGDMYAIEVDDVAYLTDRYVAVHTDMCTAVPSDVPIGAPTAQKDAQAKGFTVPDVRPALTTERLTAWVWDRVDRAGLTVHGDRVSDSVRTLHLYRADIHVGWVMPARDGTGIVFAELEMVRRIAVAAEITLWSADTALRVALGRVD